MEIPLTFTCSDFSIIYMKYNWLILDSCLFWGHLLYFPKTKNSKKYHTVAFYNKTFWHHQRPWYFWRRMDARWFATMDESKIPNQAPSFGTSPFGNWYAWKQKLPDFIGGYEIETDPYSKIWFNNLNYKRPNMASFTLIRPTSVALMWLCYTEKMVSTNKLQFDFLVFECYSWVKKKPILLHHWLKNRRWCSYFSTNQKGFTLETNYSLVAIWKEKKSISLSITGLLVRVAGKNKCVPRGRRKTEQKLSIHCNNSMSMQKIITMGDPGWPS